MKLNLKTFVVATLLVIASAVRSAEAPVKTEAVKISRATNGESVVMLAVETQKKLGLEITNLVAAEWLPEIKAFGHVVDPAPLKDLLSDFGRALMTFDTSHQELERSKQLKKDSNLSEKAFQEIEATYRQNFLTAMVARQKIETAWGGRIAEMTGKIVVPPGTPRKPGFDSEKALVSGGLIRIDVPAGERLLLPQSARIVPLAKRELPVTASFFDRLPAMDVQTQQQGLLFLNDQPSTLDYLTPGEAVTAYIKSWVATVSGVTVPAVAVLRHEGKAWIILQKSETNFMRHEISLSRPVEGGFFIAELSATNRFILTGAQAVLSAELTGGQQPD